MTLRTSLSASFLKTRVGRRLLLVFLVCALGPVGAMTWLAHHETSSLIERQSEAQLQRASKAMGMAVVSDLGGLDATFNRAAVHAASDAARMRVALSASERALTRALLALNDAGDTVYAEDPALLRGLELTPTAREQLARGRALLLPFVRGDTTALAYASQAPTDVGRLTLVARLNSAELFGGARVQGWRDADADYCVLSRRRPVWCSLPEATWRSIEPPVSAGDRWRLANGRAVRGASWAGFATYTLPNAELEIAVFNDASVPVATSTSFSRSVVLLALSAIVLVFLASHVLLRRALHPLEQLTRATNRVGSHDYGIRVNVQSDDEFGTLAAAFNDMSGRIQAHVAELTTTAAITREALEAPDVPALLQRVGRDIRSAVSGDYGLSIAARADGREWVRRSIAPGTNAWVDDTVTLRDGELRELREGRVVVGRFGGHEARAYLRAPTHSEVWESKATVTPLFANGEVIGLVSELHPTARDQEIEADGLRSISGQLALAINRVRLVGRLEQFNYGTLTALARAVDANSPWTSGHSERVTHGAMRLGDRLRLGSDELDILHRGGLLHDIGKIGVPATILDKPSRLTPEEERIVRLHPEAGAKILAPIDAYAPMLPIVLHHHEKFDGSGYPHGLRGNDIPFLARVVAVADVYDALVSERPYRPGWSPERAFAQIRDDAGTHFDPVVVDAFIDVEAALRGWYLQRAGSDVNSSLVSVTT